jgi:exodeoxyribonuclease III
VPAGGDVPDPTVNAKFAHKLAFLDEMGACATLRPSPSERAIMVGDLNVAPLESDVWSHKQLVSVVSHTPIECEKLIGVQKAGGWIDAVRGLVPEPTKLFTWWSYRSPDWTVSNRGRRLDHIWTSNTLADRVCAITVAKDYRSARRPSDHVPVSATIEV